MPDLNFNAEQKFAVAVREGVYNCIATAGAGKTSVLVERVNGLLRERHPLDQILALTFTTEAAANMSTRLGLAIPKSNRAGFRTFHSLGLLIIRSEARFLPFHLSPEPFPQGPVLSKLISEAMKKSGVPRKEFKAVRATISHWKRNRIPPVEAMEDPDSEIGYPQAYELYQTNLRAAGLIDYDDMIIEAVNLLETNEGVRARWQYKWVMCDEAQDTDSLQLRMLQLISARHNNVFVVGDYCQAIYAFRGANPENLLRLQDWFEEVQTITLPENFRSTQKIVSFCQKIAPIDNELTRGMRTANTVGEDVKFRMYSTAEAEAENVLAAAERDPGKSCILARTNQQLAIYETLCIEKEIKFFLLGHSGFWHQPEVNAVVQLVDFLLSPAAPKTYNQSKVVELRNWVKKTTADSAIKAIIEQSGLEGLYTNDDFDDDDNFALSNLRTLSLTIAPRFRSIEDFLKHARKAAHASRRTKNALTLSTVHQMKGLEADNVFVIGVQDGKMPHERGEIEEEKRIFFVACTRAAKRLQLSFSGGPSSFIEKLIPPDIKAELNRNVDKVETLQKQVSLFN